MAETAELPNWVPDHARTYLAHVIDGVPIRELARRSGCHASTVLRQVRRCESRRDDPLVDHALIRLGGLGSAPDPAVRRDDEGDFTMTMMTKVPDAPAAGAVPGDALEGAEALRVLRRLSEPGACLAVADGLDNAVVVRETTGDPVRTAVVSRAVAEAMALRDWIAPALRGKVTRYRITAAGRAALKDLMAEAGGARSSVRSPFGVAESPLAVLARRRDKDGARFLSADLVTAGERLREDFELAQMGQRTTQNWDAFLTGGAQPGPGGGPGTGPEAARQRVERALAELGAGLGDVVLRCCCYLEGMEAVERRMGWAARSGKIVLRIGLQRLRRHYDETEGRLSPPIG
ncbi:helix-turn-helix domain-containing protein [Rhodobacteraceae bacterium CCMM004]|nr:helix-turn-helix domain-containing protein [Rhodobacteraceae bacterium CCMM004]